MQQPDPRGVMPAAELPGIPAWYGAYLLRRRARTLRLHELLAGLWSTSLGGHKR